jgi:hypothetical protein
MNKTQPSGEAFEGRSAEMKKNSPWLASEDLLDLGDVAVEIEGIYRHRDVEFDAGRREQVVYSLKFKGKQKQMVLNSTNRRTLVQKFGANVQDWKGRQVTLFVDTNVRMMGKTVNGLRIK